MEINFNNKVFKVILNDGVDVEVNEDTVFFFKQNSNVIHADYIGGKVKAGKFIGILLNNEIHFKYVQVNINDEFQSGHSVDKIEITQDGRIRLVDEWEWESKEGKGKCILEEV